MDIDLSREILLEEKIGAGAFGSVYRGPQSLHGKELDHANMQL